MQNISNDTPHLSSSPTKNLNTSFLATSVSTTITINSFDPIKTEQRILELCAQNPDGINDVMLQQDMPFVTAQQRLAALNRLLSLGKLDLLKSSQLGIVYRLRNNVDPAALMNSSSNSSDIIDERLVYTIIKESGNKGIWIRDIATKTNVKSAALNKTLKSLETKKLIKSVTSVNTNKKKVYMLFELDPDRSITGGAWYSGKEFESEFVEILNEQCYRYLCEKRDNESTLIGGRLSKHVDPLLRRKSAYASSKEIRDYIKNLGISKIELSLEDIETILNTLVFDCKVERIVMSSASLSGSGATGEQTSLYRAIEPLLLNGSGNIRMPCGICPVINDCHEDGPITPQKCVYMKEWLEF
jgi:DNA-directed RNA polymerase III subunit RPC6